MNTEKLIKAIALHRKWLSNPDEGERMNLSGADLHDANLHGADLRGAKLIRADLRWDNLSYANLHGADLSWADLRGADLRGADLRGASGNNAELLSLQSGKYLITRTKEVMAIGCEQHSIEDWMAFDDARIKRMDSGALEWWKVWKPIIQQWIEATT